MIIERIMTHQELYISNLHSPSTTDSNHTHPISPVPDSTHYNTHCKNPLTKNPSHSRKWTSLASRSLSLEQRHRFLDSFGARVEKNPSMGHFVAPSTLVFLLAECVSGDKCTAPKWDYRFFFLNVVVLGFWGEICHIVFRALWDSNIIIYHCFDRATLRIKVLTSLHILGFDCLKWCLVERP